MISWKIHLRRNRSAHAKETGFISSEKFSIANFTCCSSTAMAAFVKRLWSVCEAFVKRFWGDIRDMSISLYHIVSHSMFHLILAVWANIKIYKPTMLNLVLKCPEMPWYFVGSVSAIAIRWPRLSSTLTDVTEIWDRVHMSEVCQSVTLWSKYIRIYPSIYPSIFAIDVCFSSRCMWSHLAHVQDHSISYRLMLLNTEFPAELWTKKHHSTTEAATRSRSYQKTPLIIFSVLWVELQLPWLRTKQNICRSSALFSFGPVWVCGVMWRPISRLSTKGESSSLLSQRTRRAYSILRRVSSLESQEFTFHCPGSFCLESCWKRRIQGPKWLLAGTCRTTAVKSTTAPLCSSASQM